MNKTLLIKALSLLAILLSSCAGAPPAPTTEGSVPGTQPPAAETTVAAPAVPASAASSNSVSFTNDVMPIFQATCIKCHGREQIKAGLDLRTYETTLQGSFKRVVIVPGDAANSFLVQQVINGKMPKLGQKLSAEQIKVIAAWINAGALNN